MTVNPLTPVYGTNAPDHFAAVVDVDISQPNLNDPEKVSAKAPVVVMGGTIDAQGNLTVATSQNFSKILQDNGDSAAALGTPTVPGSVWQQTLGSGDLIQREGNAINAGWITISKDPLSAGTTSLLTSVSTFSIPIEMSLGIHTSQRTYGQELIAELVSTDTYAVPANLNISSIQQATTTLTVTTATAHNLHPGMRIGIVGVTNDSRLNYPSLVVASTPSATQFTATAGPQGTIASLSVGPYATGQVYLHDALGGANDGTSLMFDNATATSGCAYVRSGGGPDELPMGGTLIGSHAVTFGTSASVIAISAALTYVFQPTTEYRLAVQEDRITWADVGIDAVTSQITNRAAKTQIVPSASKEYNLRFRAINLPSFTAVSGQIQSATKTASTTATIVAPTHGLTTGDWIVTYGVRDTVNFANLTAATQVASVIDANTFTIIWGASVTATSYGGFFARVRGQQVLQGVSSQVAQSVSRTNNIVSLVGSAAWAGFVIGDLVNLIGIRDNATGATLNLDGPYRVRDIQTTTAILEPVGATSTGIDVSSVNCGGGIVKRTDFRIGVVRLFDYARQRVEILQRGVSDVQGGVPVVLQGGSAIVQENMAQIAGSLPLTGIANGSTNRALGVSQTTAVLQVDQSATAFAGAGSVLGTIVASAQGGGGVISSEINVSALALGTATAVFAILQESRGGSNFSDIWCSPPITATGTVSMPAIPVAGRRRWRFFSVGGTSTTVTVTISSMELPTGSYPLLRQGYDAYAATNPLASMFNSVALAASSLVSTTLNSASSPVLIEGCKQLTAFLTVTGGTPTTAPVYSVEVSWDGTNWFTTTATLSLTAAGTFVASLTGVTAKFARLKVTTASAGGTAYTIGAVGILAVN